jgi:hypothetical protein
MSTIQNGANTPLNVLTGTLPDVSGALKDYFQPMVFQPVKKTTKGFQVVEKTVPINFRGVIMPLTERSLQLKPEGQRAWSWFQLYAEPVLELQVDDVVLWDGRLTRVMGRLNYFLYGYAAYSLVQDWVGAGPRLGATP